MKYMAAIFLMTGMVLTGCMKSNNMNNKIPEAPDYSQDFSWLSNPSKVDKPVDVFYVYPTIYIAKTPLNMDISDNVIRENAKGLLVAQGGVYSPWANMFAPFYRQQTAAVQSMAEGNGGADAFENPTFQIGAKDVERAFEYYLEHLNPNRPFILAGHSQGTMTLINLIRQRLNDSKLQKRLVAAYLLGYSVTKDDLKKYPWMKLAQGENDTGVIITFNTEGPNAGPSPVLLPGATAINPLNWKTDGTPADRETNMGAIFFNDSTGELLEEIPNFAGAYVDTKRGVLIVTNMKTPTSANIDLVNLGRWPTGVYHRYDYSFWFNNIKANVKKRIDAYLAKQEK